MRNRILPCGAMLLIAVALFAGCARGPSEQELKQNEIAAQMTTIRETYQGLQQTRADIEAARQQQAEIEAIAERQRSDEQKQLAQELPARIGELETARDAAYETLQQLLADYLNVALNDFPEAPDTKEALVIYSDESMVVADDIVAKAGDYAKAIDSLQSAVQYHEAVGLPVHQPLLDKLAELEDWRYITQERFDAVANGMDRDAVKATVGVPYYGNIQEDAGRGVETWLYRKRDGGGAAIYIKIKTGKVYGKKWDAVKTKVAAE